MKAQVSLGLAIRQLMRLLFALATCLPAMALEGRDFSLGPIGSYYRVTGNSSLAKFSVLTTGEPGAIAGLQMGDFIYDAFGQPFTATSGITELDSAKCVIAGGALITLQGVWLI